MGVSKIPAPRWKTRHKKTDTADFPRPRAKTRPHKPPPAPPGALLWTTNRPCWLRGRFGCPTQRQCRTHAAPVGSSGVPRPQPERRAVGLLVTYCRLRATANDATCKQKPHGCAWGVGGGSSGVASPLAVHRGAPRSTCRLSWPRQHRDQAPPNNLAVVDITHPIAIGPCPIATNPQGTSPVA